MEVAASGASRVRFTHLRMVAHGLLFSLHFLALQGSCRSEITIYKADDKKKEWSCVVCNVCQCVKRINDISSQFVIESRIGSLLRVFLNQIEQ